MFHTPRSPHFLPLKTVAALGDGDPWPDNAGEENLHVLGDGDPWKDVGVPAGSGCNFFGGEASI